MDIVGKVIVVTGGGNGIGQEVVLALLAKGAHVAAVDISESGLEQTAALAGAGDRLSTHAVNITDRDAVLALPEAVTAAHGRVDALVNVAGIVHDFKPIAELSFAEIERVMDVNFWGTVNTTKAFLPVLEALPEASLVNVTSMGGLVPFPGQSAYGASKAALEHSIEQWREEHPWLRFTTISLGATIPTEFGAGFGHDELVEALNAWGRAGRSQAKFLSTDEVCRFLGDTFAGLLAAPSIDMREVVLRSPSPPEADVGALLGTAVEGGQTGALSDL